MAVKMERERDYGKTTSTIFTKFGGKVAHGQRKKPLDHGDNPDHISLRLG